MLKFLTFNVMIFIPLTAQKGQILENVSMLDFLDMDMKHKIIQSINMPELDENYHLRTFKVMHLITADRLFMFELPDYKR
jgi:hypothetical protein